MGADHIDHCVTVQNARQAESENQRHDATGDTYDAKARPIRCLRTQ